MKENPSKLGSLCDYLEAIEGADFQFWLCTRGLNNRGRIVVFKVGRAYYRQDKACRTTKAALVRDGWEPNGRIIKGR